MDDEKPKSLEERKVGALEEIAQYLYDAKSELEEIHMLLERLTVHPMYSKDPDALVIRTLDVGRE
jgi:hypothetical protein